MGCWCGVGGGGGGYMFDGINRVESQLLKSLSPESISDRFKRDRQNDKFQAGDENYPGRLHNSDIDYFQQ